MEGATCSSEITMHTHSHTDEAVSGAGWVSMSSSRTL